MRTFLRSSGPCGAAVAAAMALLAGCRGGGLPKNTVVYAPPDADARYQATTNAVPDRFFTAEIAATSQQYSAPEEVEEFSEGAGDEYRLGPGDKFAFIVRGRPDISLPSVTVSPDHEIAVPLAGILRVENRTLKDITDQIRTSLERYYSQPDVTLVMQEYNNNKVFVLGRVARPGAVNFQGRGTLLEALSLAGGLPVDTQRSFLSRCMIVRGKELVLWIDLQDLLENGNLALNARLKNGDFIFIPHGDDRVAYVMGQVLSPGVLMLRSQMTLLDAVMQSGGLSRDANPRSVFLVRATDGQGVVRKIDLSDMLQRGDMRENTVLRDGDIVYVSERGASRFNYYMTQLLPSLRVIDFTLTAAERFGAMQELRMKLWGQEGFVDGAGQ